MKKIPLRSARSLALTMSIAALMLVSGCAGLQTSIPGKLEFERSPQTEASTVLGNQQVKRVYSENPTPSLPKIKTGNGRAEAAQATASEGPSDLSVSFDQMPLPTFIHAVYAGVLKANYSMDGAVSARTDLVTFRTAKPQSAAQMANLTRMLLKSYGIAVQDFGGVIRIVPDTATSSYNPTIRRGRAQPDTPASLRPVFHYIELEAVRLNEFSSFLRTMFGARVQMIDDTVHNALLLSGQPDDVAAVLEVVQIFDQPMMRGQRSRRVSPVYWSADEFARRLTDVLSAEGYSTSTSFQAGTPILIMPVPPLNSVIIFASSETVLNHALQWAKDLDRPSESKAGGTFFTYPVKFADAQQLAKTLSDLMTSSAPAGAAAAPTAGRISSQVVVNNATNSLIIKGGGPDDYRQWTTLLMELDKPTKSAMIDVVVAEVKLSATNNIGMDWGFRDAQSQRGTLKGLITKASMGGSGLKLDFLNAAGLIRGALNTLAAGEDARILSSPKIMARNGETATIQVGDEVPVLTSQQNAVAPGFGIPASAPIQTIQYRSTGVILKVRPVINSGNRIDLDISQEVSNARTTETGVGSSPTIQTRKIDTKLSLRDGATVLLAGMISNNASQSDAGVPLLKDIPFLGSAFKNNRNARERTEMIILITPYIINDDYEAESITEAFQNSLGDWAKGLRERSGVGKLKRPSAQLQEDAGRAPPALPKDEAREAPMPQPAEAEPVVAPPVPVKKGSEERDEKDGVIMSKPVPTPPAAVEKGGKATSAPAGSGKNTKNPLPPAPGKTVEDKNLLDELRRAVEGK